VTRMSGKKVGFRAGLAAAAVAVAASVCAAPASADATDDYPIPHRMIITTCTAEQILAAARDYTPVYYERYIIDKSNRPLDVQQGAIDRMHWFFSLTPEARRAYSEQIATNVFGEPMAQRWGNWSKLFFNNKGVAAKTTDHCLDYPPADMSVWNRTF
jgi:hypothetical protein